MPLAAPLLLQAAALPGRAAAALDDVPQQTVHLTGPKTRGCEFNAIAK
jgi:hypothetical protein